jgi:hypothetical protein
MVQTTEPQTFATHLAVCAECGHEGTAMTVVMGRPTVTLPCGHDAALKIVPNPRLPKAAT